AMAETMRSVLDRVAALPVPVLAAVNGDAYGGGAEVAVACDMRIAADDVRCGFNQVALGIMPAWGGIERLTALVGRGRALALMTTGRVLGADAALAQGLFDEEVPRDRFTAHWHDVAEQIARAPRDALVGIKAAQRASFPTARPDLAGAAIASAAGSAGARNGGRRRAGAARAVPGPGSGALAARRRRRAPRRTRLPPPRSASPMSGSSRRGGSPAPERSRRRGVPSGLHGWRSARWRGGDRRATPRTVATCRRCR